ncbi:response regulator [Streptomyces sp. NPDC056519]|uniref:response regulator n=1 Tax=Streptomyces sp. NPDC056519 TaxID=3345849 RepID=UPI0036C9F783
MIRVVVAADAALVRHALALLLQAADGLDVVAQACDGARAVAAARELHPDVVLADLRMPVIDGTAATRRLLALARPPAVLLLTEPDTCEQVAECLLMGASGYLFKDAPPGQVINAVRTAATGGVALAPAAARQLAAAAITPRTAPGAPPLTQELRYISRHLTNRQRSLLILIGEGLSNVEIARRLVLSESTVKTYVSGLLTTLHLPNRTQAAVLAHRLGLLDGAADPATAENHTDRARAETAERPPAR